MISRIHPKRIDLIAALATGTVGAFALVRSDISDTLPGVAVFLGYRIRQVALEGGHPVGQLRAELNDKGRGNVGLTVRLVIGGSVDCPAGGDVCIRAGAPESQ